MSQPAHIIVRQLGLCPYQQTLDAMHQFTDERNNDTPDEIWVLQHQAVFTQGQAGKAEHLLTNTHIPVVKADRGGQITYHGPGQLIIYLLIDIRRLKLGVRQLVDIMEDSIISLLKSHDINAMAKADAPGVYVDGKKIASLGLRIRKGCSFHGLALNVDMDLSPFNNINPCGYAGLQMTQSKDLGGPYNVEQASDELVNILLTALTRKQQ